MAQREKDLLKPGKKTDDCMNMLLDEIRQAVAWSRPSILIALHKSKNDQARAIAMMERRLEENSLNLVSITPEEESVNVLDDIIHKSDSRGSVFFVYRLGENTTTYTGLNMFRESIVEHQIKVIFWLTMEEINLLSHLAPDFWAFRHRVVEFPTGRNSRKGNLPAGALLWDHENLNFSLETVQKKIAFQKELLQNMPFRIETTANHAQVVLELAYLYWLAGENQKVFTLLQKEIQDIEVASLTDLESKLLNALSINFFDQDYPRDALEAINKALELTPEKGILWSNHGIICRSAGQGRKSYSSLKKGVKFDPSSYKSWGVLGYMNVSLGKYTAAILSFNEALKLHQGSVHYYPALALCHTRAGNAARFTEVMSRLSDLARDDNYLSVCQAGLLGNTSLAMMQLKELIRDGKILKAFVRRDPNLQFIFDPSFFQELI